MSDMRAISRQRFTLSRKCAKIFLCDRRAEVRAEVENDCGILYPRLIRRQIA